MPILIRPHSTRVALMPVDEEAHDYMAGLDRGETYEATIRKPRNRRRHNAYWMQLENAVQNTWLQDRFPTKMKLHEGLRIDLGYVTPMIIPGRREAVFVPDSTAFNAMSEDEHKVYFEQAMARLAEWIGMKPQ